MEVQAVLTPAQKKDKFTLGDVFLGLGNGNFGATPPGWQDYGSIGAVSVAAGSEVWKDKTPQPERGGVTTTAGGVGFDGGGDGVLRAFDVTTGKVLWTFQTGHQIAAGTSIYSVNGKEYVAITVGGTVTSSNGGQASQLQVFALGGSSQQSSAPVELTVRLPAASAPARVRRRHTSAHPAAAAQGVATIVTRARSGRGAVAGQLLERECGHGRLTWNGTPVVGADIGVDSYQVPRRPTSRERFSYDIDDTVAGSHVVHVTGVGGARALVGRRSAPDSSARSPPRRAPSRARSRSVDCMHRCSATETSWSRAPRRARATPARRPSIC